MKVIGLTGGIGSGKSTVARLLENLGAAVIDADKIGHELLKPGSVTSRQVVNAFGEEIVAADGAIDRARLGRLVFGDTAKRELLNSIMHPPMHRAVRDRLEQYRRQGAGMVVLEAPLLFEAGWQSLADWIWVTTAPEAVIRQRTGERSGLDDESIRVRINSQLPPEERVKNADAVINTDCPLDELEEKVSALWAQLRDTEGLDSKGGEE